MWITCHFRPGVDNNTVIDYFKNKLIQVTRCRPTNILRIALIGRAMAGADKAFLGGNIWHQTAQMHADLIDRHQIIGVDVAILIRGRLHRGVGRDFDNKELAIGDQIRVVS